MTLGGFWCTEQLLQFFPRASSFWAWGTLVLMVVLQPQNMSMELSQPSSKPSYPASLMEISTCHRPGELWSAPGQLRGAWLLLWFLLALGEGLLAGAWDV